MRCEPPCAKNEMKCPGDRDGNGCHESDFCVDRGYDSDGGLCPGYCPFECKIDENQCPGTEQCSTPTCKPKQKDDMGRACPYKNCPVTCKDEAENLCKGVETVDGCLTDDVCVLKKYSDNEVECPAVCPVTCDLSTEILCNDQKMCSGPESGCALQNVCKPVAKGDNNEPCPSNSASHKCPMECCEPDYVECPTGNDEHGCKTQAICAKKEVGYDGEYCSIDSVCPLQCDPHEVKCERTGVDDNGCSLPDFCITQMRNYHGQLCPVHCPPECDPEIEILCPGGM